MKSLLFFSLAFISIKVNAQLIFPFNPVKSVTQKGDITFAANSITQCTGSGGACTGGRAEVPPAGTTNNQTTGIAIGYIDQDGGTGIGAQTFSSSNSTLDMGGVSGCGVIFAYLTWGGFVTTGNTNYAKRDSVYFRIAGGTSYNKLKADLLVDNTAPYNRTYHCYKDVTALVRAAGPGVYTTGNVVAATGGTNQFAGWTLVVIYSDPSKPLRNLSIFRGLAGVSGTSSVQFGISGFFTPPAPAPVNITLGVVAYDGDRALPNAFSSGLPGDSLKFNGVPVSNGKNPASDIFNSTITNNNAEYTRSPAFTNTLGYDADLITLANGTYSYLGNSASGATLRISSGGETILTDIVTTAIDVFEPEMRFEKTFVNLNGNTPAQLGDIIEYTLKVYNRGSDPADSLTVIDSLYGALNYVPNSMSIVNGPLAGSKTDDIADDQMDYFPTGNYIKARLGNNADGINGGKLNNFAPDSVTTIRFRASITNDCTIFHCMDSVFNMAYATYYGQTAIQKRSTFSTATGTDPGTGCPLTGPTGLKVQVPVCTLPADTSISACTPYPLSLLTPKRPGYTTFYNSSFTQISNATATGTYYAVKSIYPSNYYLNSCNDTIQINFTANGSTCTLPVRLIEFTAVYNKPAVELHWSTSQEINNDHFEIERSTDGIHFEIIASVAGNGTSSVINKYRYTDNNFPAIGKLFYRIRQFDTDGKGYLTTVRMIILEEYKGVDFAIEKIVPNPAHGFTDIITAATSNRITILRVYDMEGKTVIQRTMLINKGTSLNSLDISTITPGMYLVEMTDRNSGSKTVQKLIVK